MDIEKELAKDVPREYVTTRKGSGGIELDYVTGRYVKQRLNEVFGWNGWSLEIVRVELFKEDSTAFAHVRLVVFANESHVVRDGLAYGYGRKGAEGFDFAIAEAVTDALKRAAVTLGQNMGLSLYPIAKGKKSDPQTQAVARANVDPDVREIEDTDDSLASAFEDEVSHTIADGLQKPTKKESESLVDSFADRIGRAKTVKELDDVGAQVDAAPLSEGDKAILRKLFRQARGRIK